MRSAHFEVRASRVIDRRSLSLTRSLAGHCYEWSGCQTSPLPPPPPLPDPRGKGVSFILWSAGCCLRDASHSTCAFSDGDFFNALADEDFDPLQLTEEERAELVAVVNQEGNDTTHTTGESIFTCISHIWKQVSSTGANTFGSNCMWWVWKALPPHLWLAARLYCKHSHKFQSHIGGCNPSPSIQPRKHSYTIIQFHANSCMYVHTCVCMLS